jgi:hypothetical protein
MDVDGGIREAYSPNVLVSSAQSKWISVHLESRVGSGGSLSDCRMKINDVSTTTHSCGGVLGPDIIPGSKFVVGQMNNINTMISGSLGQVALNFEIDKILVYRGASVSPLYDGIRFPSC